jgi:hypothetical protein
MEYMIGTILSHIPNIILFDFHLFVKKVHVYTYLSTVVQIKIKINNILTIEHFIYVKLVL